MPGFKQSIGITLLLGFMALSPRADGHQFQMTAAKVSLQPDRTFRVEFRCDLDALALGIPGDKMTDDDHRYLWSLSEDERRISELHLRSTIDRRLWLRFDGKTRRGDAGFPEKGQLPAESTSVGPYFGNVVVLSGDLPSDAQSVSFQASRAFGVVVLTLELPLGGTVERTLAPGATSDPIPLWVPVEPASRVSVAFQYAWLGFEHILPKGLDHILFVLCLYLLSTRLAPLLWQVTAFTVAHSVTLALSMYDVVSLPSDVVEPLIALSIAVVAVENLVTSRLQPWRPVVVFAFGLLHGLGFAGVLTELGLPRERYVTALVSFNVGVELGQIAVIVLAAVVTVWFRERSWYRSRVVIPASLAIATVGLYWAVERTFG